MNMKKKWIISKHSHGQNGCFRISIWNHGIFWLKKFNFDGMGTIEGNINTKNNLQQSFEMCIVYRFLYHKLDKLIQHVVDVDSELT